MTINPDFNKILAEALAKDDMNDLDGADITINATVVTALPEDRLLVRTKSGFYVIKTADINTYRPKEPEITEDKRRGK